MGVAAEIIERLAWTAEWRFGVDHPFAVFQWGQIRHKTIRVAQLLPFSMETEVPVSEGGLELFEEQAEEQTGQHVQRQKEAGKTGYPSLAIRREAAARHHAMQMRVMKQVLSPRMKHGEESDLSAEMLRIAGNGVERLRGGAEQNVVNHFPVVKRDLGDLLRHSEDHVEVFDRQQLSLSCFDPFGPRQRLAFRAMAVPARVVADACIRTLAAFFDVAAQRFLTTSEAAWSPYPG